MAYISVVFKYQLGTSAGPVLQWSKAKNKDKMAHMPACLCTVYLSVWYKVTNCLFIRRTALMMLFSPYKVFGCTILLGTGENGK